MVSVDGRFSGLGVAAASMKMISPPIGVQTSPVATPGRSTRSSASSFSKRGAPRILRDHFRRNIQRLHFAFGKGSRRLAADGRDLALEVADACLTGIAANEQLERIRDENVILPVIPCSSACFGRR